MHTDTSLTVILRHLNFSDQLKIAYNYISATIAAAPRPSRRVATPVLQPRGLHACAVYRTALHCRRESARLIAFLQRPGAARYRPSHAQGAAAFSDRLSCIRIVFRVCVIPALETLLNTAEHANTN